MDGADRREVLFFKVPDSLEVLDADAFIVLGAAGEYLAIGGSDGGEWRVGPLGGLGGDGVEVGVKEEGREGGIGAGPGQEEDGLSGGEFKGLDLKIDGEGLGFEKGNGGGVVGARVGGVDAEVALEASDGRVLRLLG